MLLRKLALNSIIRVSLDEVLPELVLRAAEEHRLPVVVHLPDTIASPILSDAIKRRLEEIATLYPALRLVLAHLGLSQSPHKIVDTLGWIEARGLREAIHLDISAVTIAPVLEAALSSDCHLVYGSDIDFSLTERGRYFLVKAEGELAGDDDPSPVSTVLISTSFGGKYRRLLREQGKEPDRPMFVYQLEAIIGAVNALRKRRLDWTRQRLKELFYDNAERLLGRAIQPECSA